MSPPHPAGHCVINGQLLPLAEARISPLDLGFLRGIGVFETLRTYDGHPHALADHLQRLWQAARVFGVSELFSEREARAWIRALRQLCPDSELHINIIVTPGIVGEGVFGTSGPATWVLIARPLRPHPAAFYEQGLTVITHRVAAEEQRIFPTLKTTSYVSGFVPLARARAAAAHEALYVLPDGCLSEGVTSNVLLRRGDWVSTPPAHRCLPGITLSRLRPIAESLGLRWRSAELQLADLYSADEVWLSSSLREVLPVVRVDDRPIGDGRIGAWWPRLHAAYRQHCLESARAEAAAAGA